MSATSIKTEAIGTEKPYQILTMMLAQANLATWDAIGPAVWQSLQQEYDRENGPKFHSQMARAIFPITMGVKMTEYLKGVQTAT